MNKSIAFQYLVQQLVKWHKEKTGKDENDLSVMKSFRLLFFVSAMSTKIAEEGKSLLDSPFNNMKAFPFGTNDFDIHQLLFDHDGELEYIKLDNKQAIIKKEVPFSEIDVYVRGLIDISILDLKRENPRLIALRPFDLVDLSRKWFSWQKAFSMMEKEKSTQYFTVNAEDIKNDARRGYYYHLSPFM